MEGLTLFPDEWMSPRDKIKKIDPYYGWLHLSLMNQYGLMLRLWNDSRQHCKRTPHYNHYCHSSKTTPSNLPGIYADDFKDTLLLMESFASRT